MQRSAEDKTLTRSIIIGSLVGLVSGALFGIEVAPVGFLAATVLTAAFTA
jgi:hypothetical protein